MSVYPAQDLRDHRSTRRFGRQYHKIAQARMPGLVEGPEIVLRLHRYDQGLGFRPVSQEVLDRSEPALCMKAAVKMNDERPFILFEVSRDRVCHGRVPQ